MTYAFHWINWLIVLGYLAAIAAVGFWFVHRNKNSEQYFKGDGNLPWWAVALSLYAALFSSITFLSVPALSYATDMTYLPIILGAFPAVYVAVRWYMPFFRKLRVTSAYEFLEQRFNLPCRVFASTAFMLFMVASVAVVTYLPAVALAGVTGISVNLAILIVVGVTILYSACGGLEAVVWSDFVQGLLLLGSMGLIVYLVISGSGGWSKFVATGMEAAKFRVLDLRWSWSQPCLWVTLLGGLVAQFTSYTSDQRVVQRYLAVKDEKSAAKSMWTEVILGGITSVCCFLMGVGVWIFCHNHPEVVLNITKNDQVLPLYVARCMPNGVSGVVFAAIAAATVSTLAANLNSCASVFTVDFYDRLFHGKNKLLCGRICTVVAGILGGGFALVLANMQVFSIFEQFQRFLGILTAGLAALFFLGIFMKKVNGIGAVVGLLANYVVTFGLDLVNWPNKPHLLLFGFFGFVVCMVVAPLVSALTGGRKSGKLS